MIIQNLNDAWNFSYRGYLGESGSSVVNLPHDWSITKPRRADAASEASGGFFLGADLSYERLLELPGEGMAILEFEGVYCNAEVRLNGHLIHTHHYGYTGFLVDISDIAMHGQPNRLKVNVYANARPDARWYTGAGIYRPVWLHASPSDCVIHPWGLTVETLSLADHANLRIRTNVAGRRDGTELKFTLCDAGGKTVYEGREPVRAAGETLHDLALSNPMLWSAVSPYLYTLRCELMRAGKAIDDAAIPFGVRTIVLNRKKGLRINGENVKLRGGCVHHDNGLLGAASFDRAEERKVELMKASGYNAIRCAHNPPAPSFLRACDRLGMYVMDEAFDVWQDGKNPYDYHNYFAADWQNDLDAMVLRDRRHPSVIFWSTGNEIPERDGRLDGYSLARTLAERVKALDASRPVTNCLNQVSQLTELTNLELNLLKEDPQYDLWAARTSPFTDCLDLVGYNYLRSRYAPDGEKFPDRLICGTESFPLETYDIWQSVNAHDYVIGDFLWTSIDYLGEAGIGHVWRDGETGFLGKWPWHIAHCGDIDICGGKRPQSYYRDAVWGIDKAPCIAVMPPEKYGRPCEISRWGWPDVELFWDYPGSEGKTAGVEVYSSCDEIELLLNDKSLGRKSTEKCKAEFACAYRPGCLKAIGYRDGIAVCESELVTAQPADRLRMISDIPKLTGGGNIAYITIDAVDGAGHVAATESAIVTVSVAGGRLLALGSPDPVSDEDYCGPTRRLYKGRLTAVVQSFGEGPVRVTAECSCKAPAVLEL